MTMNFNFSGLLIVFLLCVLLTGCMTFNNLSTGRSLGKGIHEITPSLSTYYLEGRISPPAIQVIYNYGLTEKLDIGANLSFAILGVQARYQIIGDQESFFCMAPGLSFCFYDDVTSYKNSSDGLNFSFRNLSLPINMSVHPSERLAIYFSPKIMRFSGRAALGSSNASGTVNMIGFTPGFEYGRKFKFIAELNILSPLNSTEDFKKTFGTLSVGFRFKL
jgi:hypothetical protein